MYWSIVNFLIHIVMCNTDSLTYILLKSILSILQYNLTSYLLKLYAIEVEYFLYVIWPVTFHKMLLNTGVYNATTFTLMLWHFCHIQ